MRRTPPPPRSTRTARVRRRSNAMMRRSRRCVRRSTMCSPRHDDRGWRGGPSRPAAVASEDHAHAELQLGIGLACRETFLLALIAPAVYTQCLAGEAQPLAWAPVQRERDRAAAFAHAVVERARELVGR